MTPFENQKVLKICLEKEGKKLYKLSDQKRKAGWKGQLADKNATCHAA
jgi:hypothetical protein